MHIEFVASSDFLFGDVTLLGHVDSVKEFTEILQSDVRHLRHLGSCRRSKGWQAGVDVKRRKQDIVKGPTLVLVGNEGKCGETYQPAKL